MLKPKTCNLKPHSGQSTLEILIAFAILILGISAVIVVGFGNQSLIIDTQFNNQALYLARQALENTLVAARVNFNGVTGTSSDDGTYSTEIIVENIDSSTKKITSRVTWEPAPLRSDSVELTTLVTNWKEILAGLGCKAGPLSGNWASPRVLGSADLGPGNEGTDVVVSLPYVYVSGVASAASKPDIFVFDATNPAAPNQIAAVDIGGGGINALFLHGGYLYAASPNDQKELIIFDISDPVNISEVGSLNLAGAVNALTVYAFENTAVIGRNASTQNELVFIDVTNPAAPSVITSVNIDNNVNDFAKSNDYLYVATGGSGEGDKDIWIYDITNPQAPVFVSSFNLVHDDDEENFSVALQPPANLLVGADDDFVIADVSDPLDVRQISSFDTDGNVMDMVCVVGDLVFLATQNSNKEFIVVDASNPGNPIEKSTLNFPQVATGIDFAENKVFLSVRSNDALRIITSGP